MGAVTASNGADVEETAEVNEIHQISLKLRLGIDPAQPIAPDELLTRWKNQCRMELSEKIRAQRALPADRRTARVRQPRI